MVARSIYDIDGNLGETYVAANQSSLTFFSKPSQGEFQPFQLGFKDIASLSSEADGAFAMLGYTTPGDARRTLKFSAWDHPALAGMVALWEKATGLKSAPAPDAPVPSQAPAPLILFCAAMHAAMASDISVDPGEIQFLAARIADGAAIREGSRYLVKHGIDCLLAELGGALNPVQKGCLLANLVEVTMLDFVLHSAEQEIVERFRLAMGIDGQEFQRISDVILAAKQIASVAGPGPGDGVTLTPHVAFCAALAAMTHGDVPLPPAQVDYFKSMAADPMALELGGRYLAGQGIDALLAQIGSLLDSRQKSGLLANLITVSMARGGGHAAGDVLLARFKNAMGVTDGEYQAIFDVLFLMNNVSVFSE